MTRVHQLRIDHVETERLDIDHGTNNAPPPRRPRTGPQPLAPGYLWNRTFQQLIPVLPEHHPQYRENRELITETIRRWDRGER